jgi:hypothetical protein
MMSPVAPHITSIKSSVLWPIVLHLGPKLSDTKNVIRSSQSHSNYVVKLQPSWL